MGDKDIHIRIIGGQGEGISQAIKRTLEEKYEDLDIWSQAEAKLNDADKKTNTWKEIQGFFVKEEDGEKSTLTYNNTEEEKNIGDLWHTFNQWRIRTDQDDIITIAEKTWNKILEYLGIKEPDTQEQDPDPVVAPNPVDTEPDEEDEAVQEIDEEGEVYDAEDVGDVDPAPPAAEESIKNAELPKPIKIKADKKPPEEAPHIIEVFGDLQETELQSLNVTNPSNANKAIKNKDETITEYDSLGRVVKQLDKEGKLTREVARDNNGQITEIYDYILTPLDKKTSSMYTIIRDGSGVVTSGQYCEFDKKNNETKRIMLDSNFDKKSYVDKEYNHKGKVTKEIKRNADGSVKLYVTYKYDRKGNITKQINYNPDGTVNSIVEKKYKKGKLVKTVNYTSEGKCESCTYYTYDKKGNNIRELELDSDGSVFSCTDKEYNEDGKVTKEIERNSDGSVKEYCVKEYGENGDVKRTIRRDGEGKRIRG